MIELYKKLDRFLKNNPKYNWMIIALTMGIVQVIMNLIKHRFIFQNIESMLYLIGIYVVSLFLSKFSLSKFKIFLVAYIISFIILCLLVLYASNYYDYTTFIIFAVLTLFIASIITVMVSIIKNSGNDINNTHS